jgi:restriction endonuclease S subunit
MDILLCESVVMKLSDICEVGCNFVKVKSLMFGEYPVYLNGKKSGFYQEYNYEKSLIISNCYNFHISKEYGKFYLSMNGYTLSPKENVLLDYLYIVLKSQKRKISQLYQEYSNSAYPRLKRKDLYEVLIPVPSLDKQAKIVELYDKYYSKIKIIEAEIKQLYMVINHQVNFG